MEVDVADLGTFGESVDHEGVERVGIGGKHNPPECPLFSCSQRLRASSALRHQDRDHPRPTTRRLAEGGRDRLPHQRHRRNRPGTCRGALHRRHRQPLPADVPATDLIYAADRPGLRRAYERTMARNVGRLAIFTHDLFSTPHDQANRAAVAAVPAVELDLAGIALHADRKTVDKVLDKLRPHP
jgi:hypothetical protein